MHILRIKHEIEMKGLYMYMLFCRKGITSLVLERSDSPRAEGAALTIRTNGWHALDYLGIGSPLRQTAVPIEGLVESKTHSHTHTHTHT